MQLDQLQEAIVLSGGPAVVTGGPGTGKTRLCRALADRVSEHTFTAVILDPVSSREHLLAGILASFGVMSTGGTGGGLKPGVTRQALLDTLHRFLQGLPVIKANAMLIVDEAQNLPAEALVEIGGLAELEMNRKPLLQTVLVGAPDLLGRLGAPEGSSLDQGLSFRGELDPAPPPVDEKSWLQRRMSPAVAAVVVLLASAIAVSVTTIFYERLGF